MEYKYTSRSITDTMELAENIESEKFPGMVICLDGELGSGKTVFVKGFAKSLGITETITSPTFNLIKEYNSGEMPLYHMDVYRLENNCETVGFNDYFNKDAVCIIEWSDMICDCLPEERLQIKFKIIDENTRILILQPYGRKYEDLVNSVLWIYFSFLQFYPKRCIIITSLEVIYMCTLFISTFRELIEIALLKDEKMISKKEQISNRNHSIYTVPLIEKILKENNLTTKDLNEIIVIDGPGSFTGVRLGITVAKMLAYTLNIKIKSISSIEALAAGKTEQKMIITIADPKGKYFGVFNSGKLISELSYLSSSEYEKFIKTNYQDYKDITDEKLDIEAIYNYSQSIQNQNPHNVKARYIKGIEALNGK